MLGKTTCACCLYNRDAPHALLGLGILCVCLRPPAHHDNASYISHSAEVTAVLCVGIPYVLIMGFVQFGLLPAKHAIKKSPAMTMLPCTLRMVLKRFNLKPQQQKTGLQRRGSVGSVLVWCDRLLHIVRVSRLGGTLIVLSSLGRCVPSP